MNINQRQREIVGASGRNSQNNNNNHNNNFIIKRNLLNKTNDGINI